NANPNVDP
nr:Chain P, PfCSP peptide NANPNVDP [Plasmodium falciparum 3D7]7RQR_C Chain C, PfCSP peptide NANPNVDP [Plasmodium falciparum 3D7]7RQR_P Chain P, PfCSP peptide NANPNVDP [Plasmodium falciparum 3D7]